MTSTFDKSQLSTIQLKKLKSMLPYGSLSDISRKLGVNKSTVSRALDGKTENHSVIELALAIVEKTQQSMQQLSTKIDSL